MGLEAPTSGSVEGVGRVGAVFQEDRLCPQLTAEENVALVLTAEQYKVKTQYKEQIRDDLIQLGLDDEALACLPGSSPADRSAAPLCCALSGPRATRFC